MNKREAEIYIREYARRHGIEDPSLAQWSTRKASSILDSLFPEQRAFVADESRRIACDTARRGGKTNGLAAKLVISALRHPGANVISTYTHITRLKAKHQIWGPLKALCRRFGLRARPNESELRLTFPNGHAIQLFGADKQQEVEKQRGDKLALACIDEASTFDDWLNYFIDEIVEPATMDLDGQIVLAGTPANHCSGLLFDAVHGINGQQGWAHHQWTALENPHIKDAAGFMRRLLEKRGWAPDHPTFLREYKGRWVRTLDAVIYPYDEDLNALAALPDYRWRKVLGIDLGANEKKPHTAFVIWFSHPEHQHAYMMHAHKTTAMTPSELAEEYRELEGTFGRFDYCVMDMGALGKAIAKEITKRHAIAIEPAEKKEKKDAILLMQDDLRRGLIQVDAEECEDWISEANRLQWDPEKPDKEDERFPNHACDAALYGWRKCLHWLSREEDPEPEIESEAWFRREARRMEEAALKRAEERADKEWWEE